MNTLYPFSIHTASDQDEAKAAHVAAVTKMTMPVARHVFDLLPYMSDKGYQRRATSYAGVLCQGLIHLPPEALDKVQEVLNGAANRLLAMGPKEPPPAFQLICTAGLLVAFPGILSLSNVTGVDGVFVHALRRYRSVPAIESGLIEIDIIAQRAGFWLEWVRKGRPDLRNPRMVIEDAHPQKSFIDRYMSGLPDELSEEERLEKADELLKYVWAGRHSMASQWDLWKRQNGEG